MRQDVPVMTRLALLRRAGAELLGTGALVAIVVGSGIAAERLSTDPGLRLLENSLATALGLAALIVLLGPVSGAHFNPVVSIADAVLGRRRATGLTSAATAAYIVAQLLGGIGGAVLANAMFQVPTSISVTERANAGTLLGEVVATAGLVLLIAGMVRAAHGIPAIAMAVGAYIGAAYWFTSSTAFANPAVTVGRIFSDTFAGISPGSALPFLGAQLVGAALGMLLTVALFPASASVLPPSTASDAGSAAAIQPTREETP